MEPAPQLHPQYVTDDNGDRKAVILPIDEYRELVDDLKDLAELLIARGADVNAATKQGLTPLRLANILGPTEIIELLKEHGAK